MEERKTVEIFLGHIYEGMTTLAVMQLIGEAHAKARTEKMWDTRVLFIVDKGMCVYGTRYENDDEQRDRLAEEERQQEYARSIRRAEYEMLKREFE